MIFAGEKHPQFLGKSLVDSSFLVNQLDYSSFL
jgi:hypothetical protein